MTSKREFTGIRRSLAAAGVSLALLSMSGGSRGQAPAADNGERRATSMQSKFYCNIKALSPAERVRHKELTERLLALRKDVVESEKGYEFQYNPKEVSLAEVVEWVEAESKCCPFF